MGLRIMEEEGLRIQMLGGFAMYYKNAAVSMNKIGSSKSVRLLQMLLLSYPNGIPKNELIDNLYGWNEKTDVANRNKNLNNLIYRLKGQLVSCGLPEEEYVELNDGICSFRCGISVEVDVREWIFPRTLPPASGRRRHRIPALCSPASR